MIKQVLSVLRAFYRKELLRLFLVYLPRKIFGDQHGYIPKNKKYLKAYSYKPAAP
ncbi:hypothetical protein FHR28_001639 [Acinetobacter sp. BIGb0196]|jgi:hypothetical protein|nr:hypothetical protein [Acinetobacter guillouiae]MCW2251172.1 hypothetical protein [Acinetobacter sp. BIGb0204]NII36730.1 hypothetical protein [Acinetobacter sp. BIGb0196]